MTWEDAATGVLIGVVAFVLLGIGSSCGQQLEREAWIKGERRLVDGRVWVKDTDGWKTDQPLPAPPAPAQLEKAQ